MPGPWEKYATISQDSASDQSGPWAKYQSQKPQDAPASDVVQSAIDSLPMVGGVAGGILGTPFDAVSGPMGNIVGAGIGGYLGTAAKNLINSYYNPDAAPKSVTQAVTQPVMGGVEQGLMQGTGEGIAENGVKALGAAAKAGGSKILSYLGGVKPAVINEYAQYADRINKAPTVEALKDVSDNFVSKLAGDVEAKKLSVDQAADAFKGFQSDLKDAYKTAGYDARDAVTSAQQTLKDAHNARIQQLSGDIYDAVNKLKSEVQQGSKQALESLKDSGGTVPLGDVYSHIDDSIAKLKGQNTDEALAVADKLQNYKDRLAQEYSKTASADEAKRLIQGLDQVTEYSPMAGSFDKAKNSAFKGIRATLDQSLKSAVPEYREAMKPVAQNADLLNRVSYFGDKQTAAGLLQRLNAPNQMERAQALKELGNKYGVDFVKAAQPENLPEQAILNRAQSAQDALRPDRVAQKIDQTVASSRQKAALDAAQSEYQAAQDRLSPFKPLAPNASGQTTAQQKLMQLGKGNNIELTDMFQKLGKLTDTDFIQAMKDRNILSQFDKGATNGSRNTLMGATVGWALGGVTGGAYGAAAGRAIDQWGPAITKKILDGAIQVSRSPTVATIKALDLPAPIKRNMVIGLENYLSRGSQAAEQTAARVADQNRTQTNRTPARGPDAWVSKGVQNLGIQDQDLVNRLMQSPQGKRLLIQASDLSPGSKAMQRINNQIQKGFGKSK